MFDLLLLIIYLFCLVDVYFNRQSASLLVSNFARNICYAEASKEYTITESEKKTDFKTQRLETARQPVVDRATTHRLPLYHVGNILIVLLLSHDKQICTV